MLYPRFILLLIVVLSLGSLTCFARSSEPDDRPNVVLIMADDLGFECIGANGGESYSTPNLDRLAAGGMRFEHCYSQPLCTPSRVQIMTGIYNSRNYIRFGLLDPEAKTFAHLFKQAGYATCVTGKWQLEGGFEGPYHFGFDEYCLWQLTRRANRYPNPGLEINGKAVDYNHGEYGPDIVSDYACDFISRHHDQPFFLYYPMILPHWPFEPTPDSPDWDPTARRGDKTEKGGSRDSQRHFADMVAYTDKIVGKIVAHLDKLDLRRNTLVIFCGDNGTMYTLTSQFRGRPYTGGKSYLTDHGTHVPLIASWPGVIRPGQVNQDLIDFSDVLPTLAEMAGLSVPDVWSIDGVSFAPQLRGQRGAPRSWSYCWYYRNGKPKPLPNRKAGETARSFGYKLYKSGDFFDLTADPDEKSPLPDSKLTDEQQRVKRRLSEVIQQHTRH